MLSAPAQVRARLADHFSMGWVRATTRRRSRLATWLAVLGGTIVLTAGAARQLSAHPDARRAALAGQAVARFTPRGGEIVKHAVNTNADGSPVGADHAEVVRYFTVSAGNEANVASEIGDKARATGWHDIKQAAPGLPGSATKTIDGEPATLAWWTVGVLDWGARSVSPPYLVVDLVYDDGTTGRPPR